MAWSVEVLNEIVKAELAALPGDMRARFTYISRLIEELALNEFTSRT